MKTTRSATLTPRPDLGPRAARDVNSPSNCCRLSRTMAIKVYYLFCMQLSVGVVNNGRHLVVENERYSPNSNGPFFLFSFSGESPR